MPYAAVTGLPLSELLPDCRRHLFRNAQLMARITVAQDASKRAFET